MHQEYEYQFIRVELGLSPDVGEEWMGHFDNSSPSEIPVMSKADWRFVQTFAPAVAKTGKARYVDLVFKKPKVSTTV